MFLKVFYFTLSTIDFLMFTFLFNSNKFFQISPTFFSTAREAEKEKIYHCTYNFVSHCRLIDYFWTFPPSRWERCFSLLTLRVRSFKKGDHCSSTTDIEKTSGKGAPEWEQPNRRVVKKLWKENSVTAQIEH